MYDQSKPFDNENQNDDCGCRCDDCKSCFPDDNDDIDNMEYDIEADDGMTDVEADADTLRSAGYGTDEDYGFYGE